MTLTDMRVIVTVVSFVCFIGIVLWAFSSHRSKSFFRSSKSFDEAAQLPFLDEDNAGKQSPSVSQHGAQQ